MYIIPAGGQGSFPQPPSLVPVGTADFIPNQRQTSSNTIDGPQLGYYPSSEANPQQRSAEKFYPPRLIDNVKECDPRMIYLGKTALRFYLALYATQRNLSVPSVERICDKIFASANLGTSSSSNADMFEEAVGKCFQEKESIATTFATLSETIGSFQTPDPDDGRVGSEKRRITCALKSLVELEVEMHLDRAEEAKQEAEKRADETIAKRKDMEEELRKLAEEEARILAEAEKKAEEAAAVKRAEEITEQKTTEDVRAKIQKLNEDIKAKKMAEAVARYRAMDVAVQAARDQGVLVPNPVNDHAFSWFCTLCSVPVSAAGCFHHLEEIRHTIEINKKLAADKIQQEQEKDSLLEEKQAEALVQKAAQKKKTGKNKKKKAAKKQAKIIEEQAAKDHGILALWPSTGGWVCTLCEVALASTKSFADHQLGKRHQKNVAAASDKVVEEKKAAKQAAIGEEQVAKDQGILAPCPSTGGWVCTLCGIALSRSAVGDHLHGKSHRKKVAEKVAEEQKATKFKVEQKENLRKDKTENLEAREKTLEETAEEEEKAKAKAARKARARQQLKAKKEAKVEAAKAVQVPRSGLPTLLLDGRIY